MKNIKSERACTLDLTYSIKKLYNMLYLHQINESQSLLG